MSKISPKVTAATAAIAATSIGVWIVELTTGISIPPEIEISLGIVVTFAAGYLTPDPLRGQHAA